MNYSELKTELEEFIKRDFINEYIKKISNCIKTISNFYEFKQCIILFIIIEREYKKHIEARYNKEYLGLVYEIQKKYIQLASNISGNLKPMGDTIYLHEIISQIPNIEPDNKFINIILQQLKDQYGKLDYCSDIQIIVSDIIMLGEILTLDSNFLKNYLQRLFILQIHKMTNLEYNTFLRQFFNNNEIKLDFILKCLDELLSKGKYFSLKNIERRSLFNWYLHFISNISEYHNHSSWIELYSKLKNLLFWHLENNQLDEAMYLEFFIWHVMGNLFQTQNEIKKFNEEITYPASLYYKKGDLLKYKKTHNKKIKIALVKDRIAMTSVTNVEISLLKTLLENEEFKANYEISIYSCDYFEKSQDDPEAIKLFENLGIKVYNPNSHTLETFGFYGNHYKKAIKLRETIINHSTDIMIVGTNNFPLVNFLFVNRTAQKQIYWSHGNYVYNVKGIDLRIHHGSIDFKKEIIEGFEFLRFQVPHTKEQLNPNISINAVKEIRSKFPNDSVILGTIGRLIKLDSQDYLEVICKVMKNNPNTIYLACGSGNNQTIVDKIKDIDSTLVNRFYFPGHVDAHIYAQIIDIMPDTFPLRQGVSKVEYAAKGKPIVTIVDDPESKRHFNGIFEEYKTIISDAIGLKNYPIDNYKKFSCYLSALITDDEVYKKACNFHKNVVEKCYINTIKDSFIDILKVSIR